MNVFRIGQKPYINDLSGIGAQLFGGRWNPKGLPLLYTSANTSLAILESFANAASATLKSGLYLATIKITDDFPLEDIPVSSLPEGWNSYPYNSTTVELGRNFIKSKQFCLQVPSAIVPNERNILFNPSYPNYLDLIQIEDVCPLMIDNRIISKIISN